MKKYLFLIIVLLIPGFVLADEFIYNSANTISSDTEESVKAYTSDVGGKNALLVTGGNSVLNKCSIDKKGNSTIISALQRVSVVTTNTMKEMPQCREAE